jgi:alpha-L-arabinofuranosidase
VIVKVVNPYPVVKTCRVDLNHSPAVLPEGQVLILTSASLDDENSFDNARRVSPLESKLAGLDTSFDYPCPPGSLSILKLRLAR